jgi:beta-glucosidase
VIACDALAGGRALAEILCGDVNPSGKLPATFERRWEDNPVYASYYPEAGTQRVVYKEGVFVGYRGYEHNQTKPLFPFGHGLSYTKFEYGDLSISDAGAGNNASTARYEVSFTVTNTGPRAGAAVAQLYVAEQKPRVPRPPQELKGFAKVALAPGQQQKVTIALNERAFEYYDVAAKRWRADAGMFGILVGSSSEQIELKGEIALPRSISAAP